MLAHSKAIFPPSLVCIFIQQEAGLEHDDAMLLHSNSVDTLR